MSESTEAASIEPRPNGPYLVKGIMDCRNSKGEAIRTEPTMYLCRCGGSSKKPFCDGTHKKIGFSGERSSDPSTSISPSWRPPCRSIGVTRRRRKGEEGAFSPERRGSRSASRRSASFAASLRAGRPATVSSP